MEEPVNDQARYDQWVLNVQVWTIIASFLSLPLYPLRTQGSSATTHLNKNGKPILLELKNCRIVARKDTVPGKFKNK